MEFGSKSWLPKIWHQWLQDMFKMANMTYHKAQQSKGYLKFTMQLFLNIFILIFVPLTVQFNHCAFFQREKHRISELKNNSPNSFFSTPPWDKGMVFIVVKTTLLPKQWLKKRWCQCISKLLKKNALFKSETKSKLSWANNYYLHDKTILFVAKNQCVSHPFHKQRWIFMTWKFLVQKNIFSKVRGNGEANTSLDLLSLIYVYSFLELKSECRKWDTFKNWPLMKIPQYLFCCHKTWWKFPPYGAFDVLNEYPLMNNRAVGTCLQVEGKCPKWGAKRRNFKQKPLFWRNLGEILAKVRGQLTPLPPWLQQPCSKCPD